MNPAIRHHTPTRGLRRAGAVAVAVMVAILFGAGPAAAQASDGPAPTLTVADATIERCGPVVVTGAGFEPAVEVNMATNGTTEAERPVTDASGAFTFTTNVECKQASGFLKVQASDGHTSVAVDIAIASPPEPIATGPAPTTAQPGLDMCAIALWVIRVVLVAVLAAELVLLAKRQRRRRAHRARDAEPAPT